MFQMLGVFAEFEREIIRERVNAGLARARANGVKLGRRQVSGKTEERIRALRSDGLGMLQGAGGGHERRATRARCPANVATATSPRPAPVISGSCVLGMKEPLGGEAQRPRALGHLNDTKLMPAIAT
jgi:hypothetical protein